VVGATTLLAEALSAWRGTLLAIFQPAEETAQGAQAMIDDGVIVITFEEDVRCPAIGVGDASDRSNP
jgi:hypothetical protein